MGLLKQLTNATRRKDWTSFKYFDNEVPIPRNEAIIPFLSGLPASLFDPVYTPFTPGAAEAFLYVTSNFATGSSIRKLTLEGVDSEIIADIETSIGDEQDECQSIAWDPNLGLIWVGLMENTLPSLGLVATWKLDGSRPEIRGRYQSSEIGGATSLRIRSDSIIIGNEAEGIASNFHPILFEGWAHTNIGGDSITAMEFRESENFIYFINDVDREIWKIEADSILSFPSSVVNTGVDYPKAFCANFDATNGDATTGRLWVWSNVSQEIRIYANSGAFPLLHTLDLTPLGGGIELTHMEYNSVDDKVYLMRSDTGNEAILMMPATETPAYGEITTIGSIAADCKAFDIKGLGQDGNVPANISDIGDIILWLDAGEGVLNASDNPCSDGEAVKTWQDQSGNNNHATQATAGSRPLYDAVDPNLNNAPSIQFTSDWLLLPDSTLFSDIVTNPQTTLIAIFQKNGTGGNYIMYCGDRAGGNAMGFYPTSVNNVVVEPTLYAGSTIDYGANVKECLSYIIDWDAPNFDDYSMGNLGATIAKSTAAGVSLTTPQLIGARPADTLPTTARWWEGAIAEIMVFEKELDMLEFERIRRYVVDKYGLATV